MSKTDQQDNQKIDSIEKCFLYELLEKYNFKIPRFQRHYSWNKKNFDDFWADFNESFSEYKNNQSVNQTFLGSIVLSKFPDMKDKSKTRYEIIDGQQRLLTFWLFLCSVVDMISNKINSNNKDKNITILISCRDSMVCHILSNLSSVQKNDSRRIDESSVYKKKFIYDKRHDDNNAFSRICTSLIANIIGKDPSPNKKTNLENMKNYIDDIVKESSKGETDNAFGTGYENFAKLIDFLKSSFLISVTFLSNDYEYKLAYEIFEKLNNRGMYLQQIELFQNFFYKNASTSLEKDIDKWEEKLKKLSTNAGKVKAEFFFRYYVQYYSPKKKISNQSSFRFLVNNFKVEISQNGHIKNKEEILKKYATTFEEFLKLTKFLFEWNNDTFYKLPKHDKNKIFCSSFYMKINALLLNRFYQGIFPIYFFLIYDFTKKNKINIDELGGNFNIFDEKFKINELLYTIIEKLIKNAIIYFTFGKGKGNVFEKFYTKQYFNNVESYDHNLKRIRNDLDEFHNNHCKDININEEIKKIEDNKIEINNTISPLLLRIWMLKYIEKTQMEVNNTHTNKYFEYANIVLKWKEGMKLDVDHIFPKSLKKQKPINNYENCHYGIGNLRLLPQEMNKSKGDKIGLHLADDYWWTDVQSFVKSDYNSDFKEKNTVEKRREAMTSYIINKCLNYT